ncbi:MAG: class I SAM-dependent methyltransferase [Butyrivibrio hungatei]|nr:class I SAM-dependent methyltransferase [Butyrivibrio hungatei]
MDARNHYESVYKNGVGYKYKTNTRYQRYLVKKLVKKMDVNNVFSVCDIGCGEGLNTVLFLEDFPNANVLGIDLSDAGIKYAKAHFGDEERLKFLCGNILDFDLDSNKFEVVTAFEVLEHIEDWKCLAKAMTVASKKYIIVSSPVGKMRAYEKKHGHYRNFKKGELEQFFKENGFSCIACFYAGFPFWSPITRDLLNLVPGDATKAQENMTVFGKCISVILYYLFCFFSTKRFLGDQFVGLFMKDDMAK